MRTLAFIFLLCFSSHFVSAQSDVEGGQANAVTPGEPASAEELESEDTEVIFQKRNQPDINLEALRKEFEPPPKEDEIPEFRSSSHWSRFAGGLWFSFGNAAATRPNFKITRDDILMGQSTERAWGFGGLLDFSSQPGAKQSLRVRLGILRSSINPQSSVANAHVNSSLENKANLLHISGVQRFHLVHLEESGHIWGGIGAQMNYVYSTSRVRSSSTPRSRLESSYLWNLIFAIGTDIPLTDLEDILIEFQYLPTKSAVLSVGFRSSL